MPATEETYRKQSTLHIVFAVSSIAMTVAIVWMILADHLRPWKQVQREFHHIEDAKLHAQEVASTKKLQDEKQLQLDDIDAKIKQAEDVAYQNSSELGKLRGEINTLGGTTERLDTERKFTKAELDSQRSLFDGLIERGEEEAAWVYVRSTIVQTEKKLNQLSRDYETAKDAYDKAIKRREELLGGIDQLKKKREELTRDVDRVKRVIEQKEQQYFGLAAWIRNLPGLDLVPPEKIQQISLPELTINYNFKDVPRYDRCTTCHMGADRLNYDKDATGAPMPQPFSSHPHLTSGATTLDPKGNVVPAGLYLDANGPHPINSFGCTICHGGQGSGTDFTFSSHEPNDLKQKEEWEHEHHWHKMHHWDEPMLPKRFMESSCLKCHHQVTDVPQAKKLQSGYERIVKYGCTGCHTIGGEGSFGPSLTEERQVGPNLGHIGSKVSKDWTLNWIKNPHAFRPDSRMPRFYGVTNNNAAKDLPKSHAEIHAITHYLYAKSTPPAGFVEPPAKSDPAKGKELFFQKGCLACHQHRPYEAADLQLQDRKSANPGYKLDPTLTFAPGTFPESVRDYAKADYGPNLSNIAAKFQGREQGYKWLANWIRQPESYHPRSLMPNLQLSAQDAADIAAWLLTVPAGWPVEVKVPGLDDPSVQAGLDELVTLFGAKGGLPNAEGKVVPVPLSELSQRVSKLSLDEKLMYVGEKTISRLGCFGCHNIPGFESAKPIGTPLDGWGLKSPAKLDYAHINEYLVDNPPDDNGARDGTDRYYQEQLAEQTRAGFLYQKLHRPRSYDFKKTNENIKPWDERLRMPQFAFANDAKAVEEVMTFVLGLTGEKIAPKYLPKSKATPAQTALAAGSKALNRYNCTACHVVRMPQYTVATGTPLKEAFTDLNANLRASYTNRGTDFTHAFYPNFPFDEKAALDADKIEAALKLTPDPGKEHAPVTVEGMPIGLFENELTVQLWKPATIRGYSFNVGDTVTLDQTKIVKTPAVGGDFAWLYAATQAEKTGNEFSTFWNRLPPPLIREGKKVQTPWLTSFLKAPYAIRPAANLRMPRFHYSRADDSPSDETAILANYFAAVDGAEFPYQSLPEQRASYLSEREAEHPNYLSAAWTMMTAKTSPCISCHAIGQYKPTGGEQVVNGPDLRQVGPRFRPGYLEEWLAKPSRLVPYTAMPQNVTPKGQVQIPVPKTFEEKPLDQVRAIRDALLNYANAVDQQLAAGQPAAPAAETAAPAAKAGGGSE
ncbi:MAG: c-type cytochrome [Isosphaeraceae bacterium]